MKQFNIIVRLLVFFLSYNLIFSQNLSGSFDTPYKRYLKGETYSKPIELSKKLTGWKGERLYTQLVLSTTSAIDGLSFQVSDLIDGANTIPMSQVQLMYSHNVKSDPDPRTCGTYSQPRLELSEVADALSFTPVTSIQTEDPLKVWVRVNIPSNANSGNYSGTIKVKKNGTELLSFNLTIEILNKLLPPVSEWQFHLDLWQYPYQLLKHYNQNHPNSKIEIWSNEHFNLIRSHYTLLADAGQKVITAHIKDGAQGQPSMIKWIKKTDGSWDYDFSAFDKYVNEMTSLGISKQINCFSPAGWDDVKEFIPYYDETSGTNKKLSAPLGSNEFKARWNHFLTAFKIHLDSKGWFNKTVLYLDEIEESLLLDIVNMIHTNNSNWKIGLTYFHAVDSAIDNAMYDLSGILGKSTIGNRGDKISTFYTSCSQTIPNNYVTPLNNPAEMAWMGWHVANKGLDGYLRWAYDFWTLNDPSDTRDGGHTSGDYSMVYRSSNELNAETYSSYRMELLRKGIQDYEKIRIIKNDLQGASNSYYITALNKKIAEFHENSGEGAAVLVNQGDQLLNDIVKGNLAFPYCKVEGPVISDGLYTHYIQNVTCPVGSSTDLGNTAVSENPGEYSRYQGGTITVKPGNFFVLNIQKSAPLDDQTRYGVWIDWNGDLDFDDVDETISLGGADYNPRSITSQVPVNAKIGLTRLRVQTSKYIPLACGTVNNSSTRDFDFVVQDKYCSPTTTYNKLYFVKSAKTSSCAGNLNFENTVVPLNGYTYHSTPTLLKKGSTFLLDIKNSASSRCAQTGIWIDWNGDGTFNNTDEKIALMGSSQSCTNSLDYKILVQVPQSAVFGNTRMRIQVRDSYQGLPEPCLVDGVAGTTDFVIQIIDVSSIGCNPMLISPAEGTILNSTTATFTWNPNNNTVSAWKLKISNADNSNVYYNQNFSSSVTSASVNTLPTLGETLNVELSWKINGIWYSQVSQIRAKDIYCEVSGSVNESYYVQSLKTSGASENIDYIIAKAPKGEYIYHHSSKVTTQPGSYFTINMIPSAASNCARTKIWIDWNGDGDFEDLNENVYSSGNFQSCNNPYSHTILINVPSGVTIGKKRMRIQLRDSLQSEPVPCGKNNFTGTSDFDIDVISSPTSRKADIENGIKETSKEIAISPNPNKGIFTVYLNDALKKSKEISISLYSISGELIYSKSKFEAPADGNLQLDVTPKRIVSGTYLIVLVGNNNSETFTSKVLIK